MRLAGSPEVYGAMAQRLASGGAVSGDDRIDSRLDTFFRMYELLQSKGYSEPAAQHLAVEMMEGREPMARMTRRYAAIHGQQFPDAGSGSPAD